MSKPHLAELTVLFTDASVYNLVVRDFTYPPSHPNYQMAQTRESAGEDEIRELDSFVRSDRQLRTDRTVVHLFGAAYKAQREDRMSGTTHHVSVGVE